MPTFSAVALDRLFESGDSRSIKSKPEKKKETAPFTAHRDILMLHPQLSRRNTVDLEGAVREKRPPLQPKISPALYTTPESTPLPDSPTFSYPPSSPYIINHKRRGPRLVKSLSDQNVKTEAEFVIGHSRSFSEEDMPRKEGFDDEIVDGDVSKNEVVEFNGSIVNQGVELNDSNGDLVDEKDDVEIILTNLKSERESGDADDFFDLPESMSFSSNTDGEDYCVERSTKASTTMGEFFDASEELLSDSERQAQCSLADVEAELREMRLSLLMEIEKRKQVEECLSSMRSRWQILRQKLGVIGLSIPADLSISLDDDDDPVEDICRQIHLVRFVSESIGRGVAKAEAEAEMEAQMDVKNFEIARLSDRLHYYETMNKEMSHRNQEALEIARNERQKKRMRRQKWVWGSIATAITLGTAALAWSYIPSAQGSSSTGSFEVPESDKDAQ